MNKFNILAGAVGIIAFVTGFLFFSNQINSGTNVGAELPQAPALFETSLASPITATADSFTLTANSVRGGGTLSGFNCFTIDEGSAQAEFVCGTASSTNVTGVTRGISPSDGTSAVVALQFAHRRGASVKITDFPIIQILRNQNNGDATFENALRYASDVVPSGASDLADVGYVLSVVNGGSVNFDALVVAGTAGETLATSTLVYFKTSDQRWHKVDTDDATTYQDTAVGYTNGYAIGSGYTISNGGVLLKGLHIGLTGLTVGSTYYASTTAGAISTATSSLPIGQAKSATELYFDPVMIAVPRLGMNNTFSGINTFNGQVIGGGQATATASSTFTGATSPQAAFITASGTASTTSSSATSTSGFNGFAISSVSVGGTVTIQTQGIVDGFLGLTKGEKYYTQTNAGTIGTTQTANSIVVGTAISATELLIDRGIRRYVHTQSGLADSGNPGTTVATIVVKPGFIPTKITVFSNSDPALSSGYRSHQVWIMGTIYGDTGMYYADSISTPTNGGMTIVIKQRDTSPVAGEMYFVMEE